MKTYDFNRAKAIIEEHKDSIISATLGMHEDWFWTAETIWEDHSFKKHLPDNADDIHNEYLQKRRDGMSLLSVEANKYDSILIAGIYGSGWATPTLQLRFRDGSDKMIPCYSGSSDVSRPSDLLGCLSGLVQDNITPLSN